MAALSSTSGNLYQTQLSVSSVSGNTINVQYITLPGDLPNTYGNYLAIWQNADSIPWNEPPLQTMPIPANTQAGEAVFSNLDTTSHSYIIGYAVGPVLSGNVQEYGNICSTVFIPAGSTTQDTVFLSSISNIGCGSTSVSFTFSLPDGLLPTTNGAWAGLWRSDFPNLYSTAPLSAISINPNVSQGRAAFNNVSIMRGTSYAIGLFMSGYKQDGGSRQTAAACLAGFMY